MIRKYELLCSTEFRAGSRSREDLLSWLREPHVGIDADMNSAVKSYRDRVSCLLHVDLPHGGLAGHEKRRSQ